jgi:hypothetical protein
MPNHDGTGPLGKGSMTGGRRGRCRANTSADLKIPEKPASNDKNTTETPINEKEVVYGIGQGGRPFGGGNGHLWGGGRNKNFR